MNATDISAAEKMFRDRIASLRNDVLRAFWVIPSPAPQPQPAPFPAAMYCMATVDYFSSYWAGGNEHPVDGRGQTARMKDFLHRFLHYGELESRLAIKIWRHKLMHTGQPRIITSGETPARTIYWSIKCDEPKHLQLQKDAASGEWVLYFGCNSFVADLEKAVFGPGGYFPVLQGDDPYAPAPTYKLQGNYARCFKELEGGTVSVTSDD